MNTSENIDFGLFRPDDEPMQLGLFDVFPQELFQAFSADIQEAILATLEAWRANPEGFQQLFDEWKNAVAAVSLELQIDSDALSQPFNQIDQWNSIFKNYFESLIEQAPKLDEEYKRLLRFCLRQMLSMLNPSHWPLGNEEVLKKAAETEGKSLYSGAVNFKQDMENSAEPGLKRCADDAFRLGIDLASADGEVVYQNELIQLIHYRPTQTKVFSKPMLMVPPCINKFYVLDLTNELSMVQWLLAQGVDLYMISWANPESQSAGFELEDYLLSGVEGAIEFILQRTDQQQVHLAGYCIGGLFATLAAASVKSKQSIASLSLLNTMLDYQNPGEIGVFISERMIKALAQLAERNGCLSGNLLAHAFTLLREHQLLWPYVVHRYFLGEDPPADPVMYWNQDVANLPAKMMEEYLNSFYVENKLWDTDQYSSGDRHCSLRNIAAPTYLLACAKDHIVDWRQSLAAGSRFQGETRRVLASGGHVMGVLNPEARGKGRHWVLDSQKIDSAGNANEYAEPVESAIGGSWWPDWAGWLRQIDDNLIYPKPWADEQDSAIEPAPGSYVSRKSK